MSSASAQLRAASAPAPLHVEHTAAMRDPNSQRIAVKGDLWVAPREPEKRPDWREQDLSNASIVRVPCDERDAEAVADPDERLRF